MSESIKFACSVCGSQIKAARRLAGTSAKCPQCREPLNVPTDEMKPVPPPLTSSSAESATPSARNSSGTAASLVLHGKQGKSVIAEGSRVRIIRKNNLFVAQREKTLPIRNISSVEVKKPGAFAGYIQFSMGGGVTLNSSYTLTGGAFDAASDENSVLFSTQEQYEVALKIKSYVDEYQEKPAATQSQTSVADELMKLKSLADQGIITLEEFQAQKQKLLQG